MILFSSNWLILFPIAFSLFVALRLSLGAVENRVSSWSLLAVRSLILLMFWFALLATGARAHWIVLAWLMLLVAFAIVFFWKRRRMERTAMLLSCISAGGLAEQQSLAQHFVTENLGWPRRKGRGLQRDLAQGVPWEKALEIRGIAVGVYERLALRLRYSLGLTGGYDLEDSPSRSPMAVEAELERMIGRLFIFAWVVIAVPVLYLLVIFILPTFGYLYEEMGLEFPALSRWMIQASEWMSGPLISQAFGALPLLALVALGTAGLIWMFPTLLQLPIFRWLSGEYYVNAGLMALTRVLEIEPDLIAACRKTADIVPVAYVRRKFQVAADQLSQGKTLMNAFRKADILKASDVRRVDQSLFLESTHADSRQDVTWGLRQLADSRIEGMLNRYSMWTQVTVVVLTLFLALLVGTVVVGVIWALTHLITSLA